MPLRTLRFCPVCVTTEHAAVRERCRACGTTLLALLDEHGALSRAFLAARNSCCDTGCRNCPYQQDEPESIAAAGGTRFKTCDRCGGEFECLKESCWCEDVHLSPAVLKLLHQTYADCLCPSCLGGYTVA
jgi:hypothetical protein